MEYHIILVSPGVPENIGFVCRNIKTMAMTQLHLVNPCKNYLHKAKITAYQAHDVLEGAIIHNSLAEAIKDMDLVIGTTAQHRTTRKDAFAANELHDAIHKGVSPNAAIALVFGSEESGLSTEDLKLCDWVSHIPIATKYPSLNLSHAVMVYAYECSKLDLTIKPEPASDQDDSSLAALRNKSEEILKWLEVEEHPVLYQRIKDRLMLLSKVDQKLLLSLFRFVRRKIKG